jgi:hypothetical protein
MLCGAPHKSYSAGAPGTVTLVAEVALLELSAGFDVTVID